MTKQIKPALDVISKQIKIREIREIRLNPWSSF